MTGLLHTGTRASPRGALFYVLLLCGYSGLVSPLWADSGCRTERFDETARVRYVHDGDTVWLADGRKLRIIGINTPELGRDGQPDEAFAVPAREALRQLLPPSTQVHLRYDRERTDRHGRTLAHLFHADGRNVSEWLLRRGLGYALTVPPNLWQADCYQQAEQQARQQRNGLWHERAPVLDADRLSPDTRGFHLIRGKVQRIGHSRHAVWINFNRGFALRIVRRDLPWFAGMDFDELKGKQLEVRGWVQYYNKQLRMRIRHPAAMRILP